VNLMGWELLHTAFPSSRPVLKAKHSYIARIRQLRWWGLNRNKVGSGGTLAGDGGNTIAQSCWEDHFGVRE